MESPGSDGLFTTIYPFAFLVFWVLIITLIGHLSGWQRLAQRYRATTPVSGRRWRWQYGSIGWVGYNGVLILTANAEGLFMEVFWPFSLGHPRLLIPWHEFRDAEVTTFFFRRQVKAHIGFPTVATVRLPARVFEETLGKRVLVR